MKKNIDLYYFSGTGNTYNIMEVVFDFFKNKNFNINKYKIEKTNPKNINIDNTIGLIFPVGFQSTYQFIWRFFEKLPKTNKKTEIFMIDTLAEYSGGIVGPLKKLLNKKGYKTIGAIEIIMPSNLFAKLNEEEKQEKIEKGKNKAREFCKLLLENKTKWEKQNIISDVLSLITRMEHPLNRMRGFFKIEVDKIKCVKCGICEKLCPVNNITIKDFPQFAHSCNYCMRCIMFCPENALNLKYFNLSQYKSTELKNIL